MALGRRPLRIATGVPDVFAWRQRPVGKPTRLGPLDPIPLSTGLRVVGGVLKAGTAAVRAFWSRAFVRDGMVFGGSGSAIAAVQAPALAGVEAVVHAPGPGPVAGLVRRLDRSRTGLFITRLALPDHRREHLGRPAHQG